jgi:thioredoxin reductase (NADPH)
MTVYFWIMFAIVGTAVLFVVSRTAATKQSQIIAASAELPATVHPRFDPHGCISTGACIDACPEKDQPIGMVKGKPKLINPSSCIGHGDCMRVCPVQAIDLVIGTVERGVDVPALNSEFESSQPGLYIAGELGGMGLIHNAVRQGHVAAGAALRNLRKPQDPTVLDVAIVGAGPAGLGAAAHAKSVGANYRVLEKRRIGGAIASYPRGKIVMTSAMRFAGMPPLLLKRTSKESLIEELTNVISTLSLSISEQCDVTEIARDEDGTFRLATSAGTIRAQRVIVAVGRRGAPRKIGVAGDHDARIIYELEDPAAFAGKSVIVLGGGDSAIEAAHALCTQDGTKVILIHRSGNFSRAKPDNQRLVEAMRTMNNAAVFTNAKITQIDAAEGLPTPGQRLNLTVMVDDKLKVLPSHTVIACLGAELPVGWLHSMGVKVVTRRGEPLIAVGVANG